MKTAAKFLSKNSAGVLALGAFVCSLGVYWVGPPNQTGDVVYAIPTAISLLEGKGGELSDFAPLIAQSSKYPLIYRNNKPYSIYPQATAAIAIPGVVLARAFDPEFIDRSRWSPQWALGKNIAAIISALSVALASLLFLEVTKSPKSSALLALIYAFCTPLWSTASRGLWQHGPAALFTTAGLWAFVKWQKDQARLWRVAGPLVLAFLARPIQGVALGLFALYWGSRSRRQLVTATCLLSSVFLPWLVWNYGIFKSAIPSYFVPGMLQLRPEFLVGLAGTLFSPSRGLLIFSPVFFLSIAGLAEMLRKPEDKTLGFGLLLICITHWVLIAMLPTWHGGHCYGPRLMTELSPILVFLLAIWLRSRPLSCARFRLLLVLAGLSAGAHVGGAVTLAGWQWNGGPDPVEQRLWDYRDPQALRFWLSLFARKPS